MLHINCATVGIFIAFCWSLAVSGELDAAGHYTNDFAVEIDGDSTVADLVASAHGFRIVRQVSSLGSVFHFMDDRISRRSKRSAVDLIDRLNQDPNVLWAEQQRVLLRQKRAVIHDKQLELPIRQVDDKSIYQRYVDPDSRLSAKDDIPGMSDKDLADIGFNDPYFKDQWYLVNRGQTGGITGYDVNVLPVWRKGITGKGVVVTILDDGIDHTHPDLQNNYDPKASADLNDRKDTKNDPMPNSTDPSNSHGTRCAGEVAAQANNSNCCVGIAYNARIGGVRMLDGAVTDLLEAEAILFNNQYVDIYSASWGPTDDGKTMEGPHRYCSRALKDGVAKGRGGKGSIFVWATGNGGLVGDDCSCDGYVSSIYTLSIGCISDHGLSTYFSEVCPSTMAVVFTGGSHVMPGEASYRSPKIKVVTTDLHGDCTLEFQGTSSAAPLGAGCIALVLEANGNLTWRDVQHIVVETARIPNDREGGWMVNGAGYHVNHRFGFGALDCAKMVEAAQNWKSVPEQHVCNVSAKNNPANIYARGSLNQSLYADGCQTDSLSAIDHLEHVQVHVRIEHARRGDLSLALISPAGTQSDILSERPKDDSQIGINFTFMTVHNWGENPVGRWTLVVSDNPTNGIYGTKRGRLISWSLTLYGSVGELENHHYGAEGNGKLPGNPSILTKIKKNAEQAHRVNAEEIKRLMAQETHSSDSVKISSKNENEIELPERQENYQGQSDFDYLENLFGLENKMKMPKIGGEHLKRVFSSGSEDESAARDIDEDQNPRADISGRTDGRASGVGVYSKYDSVKAEPEVSQRRQVQRGSWDGRSGGDVEITDADIRMLEEIIRGLEEVLDDEK